MIYEIINPSYRVTIEADDPKVAMAACLVLGSGAYALTDADGADVMPLLLFPGSFDQWQQETGFDLHAIDDRALMECLRSALVADPAERRAIIAAVGDDREAMRRYNDERRSSLNDICGIAHELATKLALRIERKGVSA